jgi:hypothetical protein
MMAGAPLWLVLLMATVGAVVVLLAVTKLLQRHPVAGGLGVLAVVSLVALFFVAPGNLSRRVTMLPQFAGSRVLPPHLPPAPSEISEVKEYIAEMEEYRDHVVAKSLEQAERTHREAQRKALAQGEALITSSPDGTSVLAAPLADAPPISVELHAKRKARHKWIERWTNVGSCKYLSTRSGGVLASLMTALAIAVFLYVGYVCLDASTRGHFTWSLRLLSIVVFAAVCVLMAALRLGL